MYMNLIQKEKQKTRIRSRLICLITTMMLTFSFCCINVYAEETKTTTTNVDGASTNTGTTGSDKPKESLDEAEKFIKEGLTPTLFDSDAFQRGQKFANPINILLVAYAGIILSILVYGFFSQTSADMLYIMVTMVRPYFNNKLLNNDSNGSKSMFCISEAAFEAVGGTSGGSGGGFTGISGGGGERSKKSSLLKYATLRSTEFAVFVVFSVLIFGGFLGAIILGIFNLFKEPLTELSNTAMIYTYTMTL